MIRIRLAEEDRQRYQLDDWIEYDLTRPKLSEMRRLKNEVGMSLKELNSNINSEDIDERVAARAVLYWLAVNQHTNISWFEFDCDPLGVEIDEVEDPNRSAPERGRKATSPRSRRSTASARGRSTS